MEGVNGWTSFPQNYLLKSGTWKQKTGWAKKGWPKTSQILALFHWQRNRHSHFQGQVRPFKKNAGPFFKEKVLTKPQKKLPISFILKILPAQLSPYLPMRRYLLISALLGIFPMLLPAQNLDWKKNLFPETAYHPNGHILQKEISTSRIGSDGRMYVVGFFEGFSTRFDGTLLKADSLGFIKYRDNGWFMEPQNMLPSSLLLACFESNGQVAWVKTLTTQENMAEFSFQSANGALPKRTALNFDGDGNLLLAGMLFGDTLSFNGVPFEFKPDMANRIFMLKVTPGGSLVWGRTEQPTMANRVPTARSIREQNGIVEAFFSGPDSAYAGHLLMRTSSSGVPLNSVKAFTNQASPAFGGHFAHTILPDGKIAIGSLSAMFSNEARGQILVLNPDLSPAAQHRILVNGIPSPPTSLMVLPDGQLAAFLTGGPVAGANQIIWDNDTLDFESTPASGAAFAKTLFVRLNGTGCMKKIQVIERATAGNNVLTPNGNILSGWVGDMDPQFCDHQFSLKLIDRNGNEQGNLALGDLGLSIGITDGQGITNRHHLDYRNGIVAGCYGKYLFKASFPDPVINDESFTGCLSNRNVVLANEKAQASLLPTTVFEKEPGQWQVQATAGTQGEWQVVSLLGQRLKSVQMENGLATFSSSGLPGGMYLLQYTSKNGTETQRFVVK